MDQDDLREFREWYKINHKLREEETERLELKLSEVEEELEQAEGARERKRLNEEKIGWLYRRDEPLNAGQWETERHYQGLWEWKWKIERRLRELIRWERDDLEWLGRLEGRQRAIDRAIDRANRGGHAEIPEGTRWPDRTRIAGTVRKNRQHKKRSIKGHTDARNS